MFREKTKKLLSYSVGLDPSISSFGVYFKPIGHNTAYWLRLQSTTKTGSDMLRVKLLCEEVIEAVRDLPYKPNIAVFEDYGPIGRTSGKIAQRAEMCGILKWMFLTEFKIPIAAVPPTSLKAYATGRGNASKEDMLTEANVQGFFTNSHDEADAYFAAKLGERIIQGGHIGVSYTRSNP